jgi:hypothetical protein
MTCTLVRAYPLWSKIVTIDGDFSHKNYGVYISGELRAEIYHQFYLWMLDFLFLPFSAIVFVTIYRVPRMFRKVCDSIPLLLGFPNGMSVNDAARAGQRGDQRDRKALGVHQGVLCSLWYGAEQRESFFF